MKYIRRALLVVAALTASILAAFTIGVLWPVATVPAARTTTPLAIVNVTVINAQAGTLIAGQTVLIEDKRIVAVEPADAFIVPQTAQIIEGKDRYLMPALWDMHAHIYAVSPLLDLPLYLAYGVTNVRDMQGCPQPDDPFIACREDKHLWTAEAIAGERVAPRVVASTSFMANGPGILDRMKELPEFFGTATPEHARAFVRHFAARKVEAIKVYDRIPREAYFALVQEAHRLGLDVVGHRPHAVSAIHLS